LTPLNYSVDQKALLSPFFRPPGPQGIQGIRGKIFYLKFLNLTLRFILVFDKKI
jgi:hypothetical protein